VNRGLSIEQQLGRIYLHDHSPSAYAELAARVGTDALLDACMTEKVWLDVSNQLTLAGVNLSDKVKAAIDQFRHSIREVQALNLDAIDGALLLKGAALARRYGQNHERYFADIDIGVMSENQFWKFREVLAEANYQLAGAVVYGKDPSGSYQVASMRLAPDSDLENGFAVEVQLGGFPLDRYGYLPFELCSGRMAAVRFGSRTLQTPDASATFLILLAEYVSQSEITLRDLYDVISVLAAEDLDVPWVADQVRKNALHRSLGQIRSAAAKFEYALPENFQRICADSQSTWRLQSLERQRWWHVIQWVTRKVQPGRTLQVLALMWLRGVTSKLAEGGVDAVLLKWTEWRNLARSLSELGYPIYLIPIPTQEAHPGWASTGRSWILGTSSGSFLASPNGFVTDDELAAFGSPEA